MAMLIRLFRVVLFFIWVCLLKTASAKHGKSLPSAMVVGTVLCDTCFQHQDSSKTNHTISGASIAVECASIHRFRKEVKTDDHGHFTVELPFRVGKHIRSIKRCTVKLVSSSEPYCSVASTATSSFLHLKSRKQGTHIFSAGFFTFKPLNQPELCYQKPNPQISDQKTFNLPLVDPLISSPIIPNLPPLLSVPKLPPLLNMSPSETSSPIIGISGSMVGKEEERRLRPDTFTGFPPNPFFPPPILPTNPGLPSLAPSTKIPSIPFLTPPPPIIPFFPFPPFPFPPSRPFIPGIPPASSSP